MFESKPKKENKDNNQEESQEEKENQARKEKIAKEIAVHTMPAKFFDEHAKVSETKKIGILIIGGGAILMLIVAFVLYYFVFRSPEVVEQQPIEQNNQVEDQTSVTPNDANDTPSVLDEEEKIIPEIEVEDDIATTTEEELEEEIAISTETEIIEPGDNDNDGLSNLEEELLGTDQALIDSDGDTYEDLSELLNLYNPAGSGKLQDSEAVDLYTNSTFDYSFLYPALWESDNIGGEDLVIISSPDKHFLQVFVQPNPDLESIEDWYKAQVNMEQIDSQNKVSTDTWTGVRSESGKELYLTDKGRNYIFVLSYTPVSEDELSYKNIFEMMIKSFVIK